MDVVSERAEADKFLWAFSEAMLVLMVDMRESF
jgi:hypothetical protein